MKIVLKKSVPNLGVAGDVREVKSGYAINWLIPNDFAIQYNTNEAKEILYEKAQKKADQAKKIPAPKSKIKKSIKRVQAKIAKDDKKIKKIK